MERHKERIDLTDTLGGACAKMAEGNIGAVGCLKGLIQLNSSVDPDSALGQLSTILSLDSAGIYGTNLYLLWNICEKNHARVIAVMRAVQLGIIPAEKVKDACSRQDRSGFGLLDIVSLYKQVKEKLPAFDPNNLAEIV